MSVNRQPVPIKDVPRQIFEAFIKALRETDVPSGSIDRLEEVLLKKELLTESAIRVALVPDDKTS